MEASILSQVVLPLCLFIIMFGMGLSLVIADFTRVLVYPKAVLIGIVGQMLVLPLCGFLIAWWLMDIPALAIGILLLAACPGGTTSNLVTHLAKGDLALSISLTAVSSLLTMLSIPLIIGIGLAFFSGASDTIDFPLGQTILTLFALTLLPVSLGMLFRNYYAAIARKLEQPINIFSIAFLVFLVIGISFEQRDILGDAIKQTGPAVLLLNLVTMFLGFLSARAAGLNAQQITTVSIEIGIQNSTLAMLIATTVLQDPAIAIPAAVYSLVMYITGGVLVLSRRQKRFTPALAKSTSA